MAALVWREGSLSEAHQVVSCPQARDELLALAKDHDHEKLKTRARRRRLEHDGQNLAGRRRQARSLRHWIDELGLVRVQGVGVPLTPEQRAHDAFVTILEGQGKTRRDREAGLLAGSGRGAGRACPDTG